jgi:predicted O-linked N-acetylglucosamine transferase (SPINDLY family)/Tfp pilus assembly protein PilF
MNKPNMNDVSMGLALANKGDFKGAEIFLTRAIAKADGRSVALLWRGLLYLKTKRYIEAEKDLLESWKLNNKEAEVAFNLGDLNKELENYDQALSWFTSALSLSPNHLGALLNKGIALVALRKYHEAETLLRSFVRKYPSRSEGHINLGNLLIVKRAYKEAKLCFLRALDVSPNFFFCYLKLAEVDILERNYESANNYLSKIPENSEWAFDKRIRLAEVLIANKEYKNAFSILDRASLLRPNNFSLYKALSECFEDSGDLVRAIRALQKAKEISFDRRFPIDKFLSLKGKICDWKDREEDLADLMKMNHEMDLRKLGSLALMYYSDDPTTIRDYVAKTWVGNSFVDEKSDHTELFGYQNKRIVYVSPDFKDHPVGYLMHAIVESQIQEGYEIYLVYLDDPNFSGWEKFKRIATGYLEASSLSDRKIVDWIKSLNAKACVDLAGLTAGTRLSIYVELSNIRKISYLGYPGTLAFKPIPHMISSEYIVGKNEKTYYTENMLSMPRHYFPVQKERFVEMAYSRASEGLPKDKFVFSSMSHFSKITPETYNTWCEILTRCSESVLWLSHGEEEGKKNLRKWAAEGFNIDHSRIVFSARTDTVSEHISRLRCADLMLDTFPFGGHTSASDFVIASVPVLTRIGNAFHTRIAAEILNRLGLNDFIVRTNEDFISKAQDCYEGKTELKAVRKHIMTEIFDSQLFNTRQYSVDLAETILYKNAN